MIARLLRASWRDRRGAVAPMVAIMGTMLVGVAGVALDTGLYYANNRDLQAVTEAAALSAAVDPRNATSRARDFLARNGYPASAAKLVEVGRYCADYGTSSGARFHPSGALQNCTGNGVNNAVRLTTSSASQQYLTRMFGNNTLIPPLSGVATAARIDEAGIGMNTGTIGPTNGGLVNLLLSALAGTNIALSQAQLAALMGGNVDAGLMFDALAARVGETGTYSALLQRTVSLGDLMAACQTSLAATGGTTAAAAIQALAAQAAGNLQVPLAGLFDLGVWKNMPVGNAAAKTGLRAGLNSYQLIAYALQAQKRPTGLNIAVSNVVGVSLTGFATGPVDRARFAFGPAGEVTASTAVVRILLKIHLANLNGLVSGLDALTLGLLSALLPGLGVGADVPLLIQIGGGQASIASISCGQEAATDARVNVAATTGLLNAYIGQVPDTVLTQFSAISSTGFPAVTLLNVPPLLTVTVRANVVPPLGQSRTMTFTQAGGGDGVIGHVPAMGTPARVGNASQLGPLLSGLGSNLEIDVQLLGARTGNLVGTVVGNVGQLLGGTFSALGVDPLVDGLLGILGVQAGYADTWVTGARCGVPVLV